MKESAQSAFPKNSPPVDEAAPAPRNKRRPFVVLAVIIGTVLASVATYAVTTAGQEETDDAQITSDVVPVATRVAGQVLSLIHI